MRQGVQQLPAQLPEVRARKALRVRAHKARYLWWAHGCANTITSATSTASWKYAMLRLEQHAQQLAEESAVHGGLLRADWRRLQLCQPLPGIGLGCS